MFHTHHLLDLLYGISIITLSCLFGRCSVLGVSCAVCFECIQARQLARCLHLLLECKRSDEAKENVWFSRLPRACMKDSDMLLVFFCNQVREFDRAMESRHDSYS